MIFDSDSKGYCVTPDLHDGYLKGVLLQEPDTVELLMEQLDGPTWKLRIPQVERLCVDSFLEGNIIFDISIREGREVEREYLQSLYQVSGSHLEAVQNKVRASDWWFLHLSCSYGCDLYLLSSAKREGFVISQVPATNAL